MNFQKIYDILYDFTNNNQNCTFISNSNDWSFIYKPDCTFKVVMLWGSLSITLKDKKECISLNNIRTYSDLLENLKKIKDSGNFYEQYKKNLSPLLSRFNE